MLTKVVTQRRRSSSLESSIQHPAVFDHRAATIGIKPTSAVALVAVATFPPSPLQSVAFSFHFSFSSFLVLLPSCYSTSIFQALFLLARLGHLLFLSSGQNNPRQHRVVTTLVHPAAQLAPNIVLPPDPKAKHAIISAKTHSTRTPDARKLLSLSNTNTLVTLPTRSPVGHHHKLSPVNRLASTTFPLLRWAQQPV